METLIIVDFQKDFSKPEGALYVNGSESAKNAIIYYINQNAKSICSVIFTIDWHGPNHCSFMDNGGAWPKHCIQFSEGAGIDDDIMKTCIDNDIPIRVFKKGNINDTEEYGAFEYMYHYTHSNGEDEIILKNMADNSSVALECFNLVVCGLAGDYCVQETIKNLMRHSGNPVEFNISVFKDGIASIDGGKSINKFIEKNNLKVVE